MGLVSIAGTAASANKVLETAANQYKLTEAQIAALRTEAGIDSKIVGSNKGDVTLQIGYDQKDLLTLKNKGTVVRNSLEEKEFRQAADYANFRGGEFKGAPDPNSAGIDGWLDGVPVQLKEVEGTGLNAIRRNIVRGAEDFLKAKDPINRSRDLVIDARKAGVSMQDMIDHFKPGTPVSNIVAEGVVKNIYIQTNEGWLNVTSGMISKGEK